MGDIEEMFPKETKILVVDDMMTMRKLVKKSLGDLGFTNVTESRDGEAAWGELESALGANEPFQLVLSDWNMPNMMGIDLLRKVRSTEGTQGLPFVLLTAEGEASQIAEAVQAGVTGYILKPFSPATLSERLASAWTKANS